MTLNEVKEFIALYEETLTYKEMSNYTGYSVQELMDIYDDLFDTKELFTLKQKVKQLNRRGGIVRIHPLNFDYKVYEERADITNDGYISSNVIKACAKWDAIVSGYLWRYGNDVDFNNVEGCIKGQLPHLYKPVIAENKNDGEQFKFKSIQLACASGYNRVEILRAIERGSTYRHMYWRYA